MTGIALVFYFNTSPGEPRERDYVYAGSFYAFSIWIGFGVLALRELFARLTGRDTAATVAATAVCMAVPAILAAQNWDDHDRSGRYMARDIGWNYLQSTLPTPSSSTTATTTPSRSGTIRRSMACVPTCGS